LAARRIAVCPTLGILAGAVPPPRVLEMLARTGMTLARRRQMVGQAHAAGVRMVSGDDSGISLGKPHGVFAEALIDLELGGVSPPDALATATSIAADVCGVGTRKGRLVPGFDADVLVVDGDATRDTSALRSVAAVVLRGELVLSRG
jgi:imidazolonepropionase-like amidohydrolase